VITTRRFVPLLISLLCASSAAELLSPTCVQSAPAISAAPGMRPYAGIGILMLPVSSVSVDGTSETLLRYDEPAISRTGELDVAGIPRHEWIFGPGGATVPLVVMARKAGWLKVVYDDAGREAWINPGRRGIFQPWEVYFKGQTGRMLPGLQKKYYQLFRQPGAGLPLAGVTPRQEFKVILLEGDWAVVMPDPDSLSWVRWRDEDGRLLIGLESGGKPSKQHP
jgi:hypothetical protein